MTQLTDDLLAYGRLRRILLDLRPVELRSGREDQQSGWREAPMTYWVPVGYVTRLR